MITSPFCIDFGGPSHLACDHEHDAIVKAAGFEIFNQGTDRVVQGPAHVLHALFNCGVVIVGMHIPDEIGCDRDKAAA